MPGDRRPSYGELKLAAAPYAEQLFREAALDLEPMGSELKGKIRGATWKLVLRGANAGRAFNMQATSPDTAGGDMIELVRFAWCNGDRRAAFDWLCRRLGLASGGAAHDPEQLARLKREAELAAVDRAERIARKREASRKWAFNLYLGAGPWRPLGDTPVGAYLDGRGELAHLLDNRALRFHPDCWYADGEVLPAMVAPVLNPYTRKFQGAHVTYLEQVGGVWRKLQRKPNKKMYGPCGGGAIPVRHGESGTSLAKAPAEPILVAEGIENALSAATRRPRLRAFAALSVRNLEAVDWPEVFHTIVLVRDRDGLNWEVMEARKAATDRWREENRAVQILEPPPGFKDMNDLVQYEVETKRNANERKRAEEQERARRHAAPAGDPGAAA